MCGIAGQVRADGRRIEPELLRGMCAAIEHRGPDARGHSWPTGSALGIQRLRVIDLETGDQPIANEDGTVVVVLNGEIYNYRELRDELESTRAPIRHQRRHRDDRPPLRGARAGLRSAPARDVRVRALGRTPPAASARRGPRRQEAALLRLLDGARLSFASEIAGAARGRDGPAGGRSRRQSTAISRTATSRLRASAFREVRKLPPAHTLVWQDGRVELDRYWQLDYGAKLAGSPRRRRASGSGVRAGGDQAAAGRRRAARCVPLGRDRLLAGGRSDGGGVAPPREDILDRLRQPAVRRAAARRRIARAVRDGAPRIRRASRTRSKSCPGSSGITGSRSRTRPRFPSYYLAEMTRRQVTVALNGDGGDEAFGGYTRYVANPLAGRLDSVPFVLRRPLAALGSSLPAGGAISSPVQRARRLLKNLALDPAERYARYVQIFDLEQRSTPLHGRVLRCDCRHRRAPGDRFPLAGCLRARRPRHHARGRHGHLPS